MIQTSGRDLLALVDDLLDLGKLEAPEPSFDLKEVDVDRVTADCVARFKPSARERGIDLRFAPGGAGRITADRRRVEQVVTNLLSNAVKFTERGYIEVSTSGGVDSIEILVADTGPGIDPEVLPRVFDEFVSTVSRSREGGTGLGLAICREIVTQHGGDISVRTRHGEGTVFAVTLPRSPQLPIDGTGRQSPASGIL